MEWWHPLALLAVGFAGGFVNVMAGGGSLLTMPAMVFMGMPAPAANGTNRVAILAQSIAATASFFRQGVFDLRLSMTLAACAVPGTILGAYCGTHLVGVWFNRVLALIMLGVMAVMMGDGRRRRLLAARGNHAVETAEPLQTPPAAVGPWRVATAHALMVAVGFYGGAIQAGVGFLIMAIMHRVLRLDLVRVNAYKAPIGLVCAVVALAVFAVDGNVVWRIGAALAVGNAAGGWLGSVCAVRRGERLIRVVLNVALVAMVVKLLTSG